MYDQSIVTFCFHTLADPSQARKYLHLTNNNVEQAIERFFSESSSDGSAGTASSHTSKATASRLRAWNVGAGRDMSEQLKDEKADTTNAETACELAADLERLHIATAADSSPQPAASAVFTTYELLETIILALPPEDILTAAGVCKGWSAVVEGSTKLGLKVWSHGNSSKVKNHYEGTSTSVFFYFHWMYIRRVKESEVVAFFDLETHRLLVADGEKRSVVFKLADGGFWSAHMRDRDRGLSYYDRINGNGSGDIPDYLKRYHGPPKEVLGS